MSVLTLPTTLPASAYSNAAPPPSPPPPNTPTAPSGGLYAVIGGQTATIVHGTLSGQTQLGQRGQLTFDVLDTDARFAFTEGSAVQLYDAATGALLLSRWVASAKRLRSSQSGMLYHQLTCTDNCYLADKRLIAATYTQQTAQYIINDFIAQVLAQEGVYAVKNLFTPNQSSVETDTSGFGVQGSGVVTLTRDTAAPPWQGAASLKVATDGTAAYQGVGCGVPWASLRAGGRYAYSLYLRGAVGGEQVNLVAQLNTAPYTNYGFASVTLTTVWTRYTVLFTLPNPLPAASDLICTVQIGSPGAAYTWWQDGLQLEPAAAGVVGASAWELGGSTTVGGATISIGAFTSNYAQASACLDAIAQKAQNGYTWWIDDARRLYFAVASPLAPPVSTIDDTIIERDTESVTHGNTQYRNTQYVLGGTAQTAQQVETRQGDGKTTAFTMGYALATAPTITLNGSAQSVGVGPQGQVSSGKQWYWNQGSNFITQDTGGVKLLSTDTLSVTYYGQYPVVTISQDGGGVAARQTREGGSTSGIVEAVATDTTLATISDAYQAAAGYLARYNQDTQEFDFLTLLAGFAPGQSVTAEVPGLNLVGVSMLIEDVTLTDSGPIGAEVAQLYYAVKAVAGPLAQNGARFWKALAQQAQQIQIDAINLGSSGLVAIVQSGAVGIAWTVTGSATPYALQFPSSTLYPASTLYPGGTAGTPVAITWTKTQAGLNALRDVLSGAGTTLKVGYLAWGTGTQGTPATATQLANEVGRKTIASIVNGGSVGEELINGYIGSTDAVGVAITEVAFFGGPSAGAGANSGVMLLYGLYSHTHTNQEGIQITADSTFS